MAEKKERIPIPDDVAARVMFAADRTCCVCRKQRQDVQIHHIDEDPSNNDESNLVVLCLQCHNDTQKRGGFGRHLNAAQVLEFKKAWEQQVVLNRNPLPAPQPAENGKEKKANWVAERT